MENKDKKQVKDVSDSVMLNESLNETINCPDCKGGDKSCSLCGGIGKVSKRKAQNFKKA